MDKKKGGFLRGIVDNFRSSVSSGGVHSGSKGIEILEIDEPLKADHFELTQVCILHYFKVVFEIPYLIFEQSRYTYHTVHQILMI